LYKTIEILNQIIETDNHDEGHDFIHFFTNFRTQQKEKQPQNATTKIK